MEDNDLIQKVIDVGKKYYKAGQYEKARSMFTKAILLNESFSESQLEEIRLGYGLSKRIDYDSTRIWHPLLCQALNFRSLCNEKLKQYNDSLKDGKAMISYEPYNMMGYIRCGRMYESSLQKIARALKYYELGLHKGEIGESKYGIEPNEKLKKFLQTKINALLPSDPEIIQEKLSGGASTSQPEFKRKILSPMEFFKDRQSKKQKVDSEDIDKDILLGNNYDILATFPVEIINKIMSHLRVRDISQCMVLNRAWSKYVYSFPDLLSARVTISNYTDMKGFDSFVTNCETHDSPVLINKLQFRTSPSLEKKLLSMLFELLLTKTPVVEKLVIIANDSKTSTIYEYLQQNLEWCMRITKLTLVCEYVSGIENQLLNILPSLQSLELLYTGKAISFASGRSSKDASLLQHKRLTSLTVANLPYKKFKIPLFDLPELDNLKSLSLFGIKINDTFRSRLNSNFPHLQTLKLEKVVDYSLLDFLQNAFNERLKFQLKKLIFREEKISLMPSLSPSESQSVTLLENFLELRELDVYSSSITFSNLYKVVQNCYKLETLNIGNCPNLIFDMANTSTISRLFHQLQTSTTLRTLLLPQMIGINSIIFESLIIKQLSKLSDLEMLDISFNQEIDGVNLWSLVRTLQNPNLTILCNGCGKIDPNTINTIMMNKPSKLIKKIIHEYTKKQWTTIILQCYYN